MHRRATIPGDALQVKGMTLSMISICHILNIDNMPGIAGSFSPRHRGHVQFRHRIFAVPALFLLYQQRSCKCPRASPLQGVSRVGSSSSMIKDRNSIPIDEATILIGSLIIMIGMISGEKRVW
ncbi:hypothetical protein WG66_004408 [Moniliophthora roreri]|nr:hypothetical protein WG66_004408 [Moniliophthora roreri]